MPFSHSVPGPRRATPLATALLATALVATALLTLAPLSPAQNAFAQQSEQPRDSTERTSVGASYEYVSFNGAIDPWRLASVDLSHRNAHGSLIGRVNVANRFATNGVQYEADAYPRLGANGLYAYLNFGYSPSSIFPRWRSGGEIYTSLPNAYEASLGYRQLRFAGSTPVTLFTGTVGKYTGNYWLSLRPYYRQKTNGNSLSGSLTARRYFADADNYLGARVGYGGASTDRLTVTELARTNSASADVHGSRRLADRLFGTAVIGYETEQLPTGTHRTRWDLSAGLRRDF